MGPGNARWIVLFRSTDYETQNASLVDSGGGDYAAQLREGSPAWIATAYTVPYTKPRLAFDYKIDTAGDGDTLELRVNDQVVWSTDTASASSTFLDVGAIDLSAYAGQAVRLEFYLDSVGTRNAVVEIANVEYLAISRAFDR